MRETQGCRVLYNCCLNSWADDYVLIYTHHITASCFLCLFWFGQNWHNLKIVSLDFSLQSHRCVTQLLFSSYDVLLLLDLTYWVWDCGVLSFVIQAAVAVKVCLLSSQIVGKTFLPYAMVLNWVQGHSRPGAIQKSYSKLYPRFISGCCGVWCGQ